MTSCTKIKEDFWSIIQEMETHIPDFVVDPNKHFLRNRKLNFETMLKMTLLLEGRSINGEIDEFFDSNLTMPSASAFCQQRAKLLPDAFKYIFDKFNVQYSHNPTYQGYRLLACDGSECLFFPDKNQVEYHVSCNTHFSCQKLSPASRWQNSILQDLERLYENNLDQIQPFIVLEKFSHILQLLLENIDVSPKQDKNSEDILALTAIIGYVQKNYPNKILLKDISSARNCCKTKCASLFQKYLSTSPMLYLSHYRLEKSIFLLRNTTMSITEIAYACGFSNTSYFCELFPSKNITN